MMTHPCCVEQAPRHPEEPHKEAHHGRRSGVSPNRRRVTAAAAETLNTLPTVKEMHLQRVATMAAAAATAQQINADLESHDQFAKELRSYRSHGVGGGQRRVTKPSWESDLGVGGSFGAEFPPSGPGNFTPCSIVLHILSSTYLAHHELESVIVIYHYYHYCMHAFIRPIIHPSSTLTATKHVTGALHVHNQQLMACHYS